MQLPRRNGWWPRLTVADGILFVSYGVAECALAELRLDQGEVRVSTDVLLDAQRCWGGHWFHPHILMAWRERGGFWERATCNVRSAWALVGEEAGPLVGGNKMHARDGHFAEWSAYSSKSRTMDGALRLDGSPDEARLHGAGPAETADGYFAHAERYQADGPLVIRDPSGVSHVYVNHAPMHELRIGAEGHVLYGGYGPVFGQAIGEPAVDLKASPAGWREGPAKVWRGSDGRVWVATVGWTDAGDQGVLIRPWGEREVAFLPRPATWADLVEFNGHWIVATNDAVGNGWVDVLPITTPRSVVVPALPPVEVPTFTADVAVAPFFATSNREAAQSRGNHDHPGQLEMLADNTHWSDMVRARPVLVDEGSWLTERVPLQWLYGFYSAWREGGFHDIGHLERSRALAQAHQRWHVSYCDPDPASPTGYEYPNEALDWLDKTFESPMYCCYPRIGESPTDRARRVERNLVKCMTRGFKVSVALPFYTQGRPAADGSVIENWPLADVQAGLTETLKVLRNYQGHLLVLGCFAYARFSGMRQYPPLLDAYERLCAAVPGTLPALPIFTTPPSGPTGPIEPPPPIEEDDMPLKDEAARMKDVDEAAALAERRLKIPVQGPDGGGRQAAIQISDMYRKRGINPSVDILTFGIHWRQVMKAKNEELEAFINESIDVRERLRGH